MGKKNKAKGDVSWYASDRSHPIAYSTIATASLISTLSESCHTWNEIYNNIRYDIEAKKVAQAYIDAGYGDVELKGRK